MFEPRGEQARWRTVYDLLKKTPTGGIVTYEHLGETLRLDPDGERNAIQKAVHRAAKEHEQEDKRALDAVPGQGYRIVQATEHLTLAKRQQRKSNRALVKGHSKVTNVDLTGLPTEAQAAFHTVARAFAAQIDFNRRMDVRQGHLEDAVESMATKQERSDAEIAELKRRLEKLEES